RPWGYEFHQGEAENAQERRRQPAAHLPQVRADDVTDVGRFLVRHAGLTQLCGDESFPSRDPSRLRNVWKPTIGSDASVSSKESHKANPPSPYSFMIHTPPRGGARRPLPNEPPLDLLCGPQLTALLPAIQIQFDRDLLKPATGPSRLPFFRQKRAKPPPVK